MIPSPNRLGLPAHFESWRRTQARAIADLAESDAATDGLCAPAGVGKTLIALGYAQLLGPTARVAVLTATRALQDAYVAAAGELGMRDVRGKSGYRCRAVDGGAVSVDAGPCWSGIACRYESDGCEYFDAHRLAARARLDVTSYAKWFTLEPGELGSFDVLVADEGHRAAEILSEHLRIPLERAEVESLMRLDWPSGGERADADDWCEWAKRNRTRAEERLRSAEADLRAAAEGSGGAVRKRELALRAQRIRAGVQKLASLRALRGEWVVDSLAVATGDLRAHGVAIDPVWPASYAERLLWRATPKRVVMSATLVPKMLGVLGVDAARARFTEYASDFPAARRLVYAVVHSPALKLNAASERDSETLARLATTIDAILEAWQGYRAIVHTGSYSRRDAMLARTRWRERSITHDRGSEHVKRAVDRYLATPGAVLWSPAVDTGWDFPDDACRCQIVLKLPFADMRPRVMQARAASDREYPDLLLASKLEQTCGRPVRSRSDWATTYLLDGHAAWWSYAHRDVHTRHFLDALRVVKAGELAATWPREQRGMAAT